MRLFNVYGRLVHKNVTKFKMDWDKKSRSKIQFKVKQFLKPYWCGHVVFEEFPVYGTRLKVDILNATRKIAVEVQGQQHETLNPFFHQNRANFLKSIKRDVKKFEWLELNEFQVIEINYDEVEALDKNFFESKYNCKL